MAAYCHGIVLGRRLGLDVGKYRGYALGRGVRWRRVIPELHLAAAGAVGHELEQLRLGGRGAHEDQHPLAVEPIGRYGFLHVGYVVVEIIGQVGRPWQVHQQRAAHRGRRRHGVGLVGVVVTRHQGQGHHCAHGQRCHAPHGEW